MFTRLLSVFLAVILVCVGVLFSLVYLNLRDSSVESRIAALKTQARDVAYLASRIQTDIPFGMGRSTTEEYMYWKTGRIFDEYNAYTVIVERSGRTYSYYNEATLQDESLSQLPTQEEMNEYLSRAARGEEITVQTGSEKNPLFTVIVPWKRQSQLSGQDTVMGLVMIQTAAQTIRASYKGLLIQVAPVALGVFLLAGVGAFFLTRQNTRPLTAMAKAAGKMANGDFSARAPVNEGSSEIRELASSFNSMAEQLNALEQSRRDFVANVSHELRSPITSIQGFAQGMLDGTIPEEERTAYLNVVVDETRRLGKLINGLLNLSRMENEDVKLSITRFDVNELIRLVLISRIPVIEEKNIDVQADFEAEQCFVSADQDQIEQVLINLIDNALKFSFDGGTLTLRTWQTGKTTCVSVRDTGSGILPEDAPHIFERFYKADKAHTAGKGTGLGLAICRRIMEKHGQQIRLVPTAKGAEFEITLETAK